MGYANLLGNVAFYHGDDAESAGQDSQDRNGVAVDLGSADARCVTGVVHVGSRAANSTITVKLEHRAGTSGNFEDVPGATVTHAGTAGNKYVAVEANTDSVRLRRYVRCSYNRSGGNQSINGVTMIVKDLRTKGSMTMGDQVAGKVGQEVSTT